MPRYASRQYDRGSGAHLNRALLDKCFLLYDVNMHKNHYFVLKWHSLENILHLDKYSWKQLLNVIKLSLVTFSVL